MTYETVGQIINDVALELGLPFTEGSDPFAATDRNITQLVSLLNVVGSDLARRFPWSQFQTEHTFSTVDGQATYDLPAGFGRLMDQSGWDRTTSFPLGGPVSAQGWQSLKALGTTATLAPLFRIRGRVLDLHPTPSSVETVALEYITAHWVAATGEMSPTQSRVEVVTDEVWLDAHLVGRALKLRFLEAKGFPADSAMRDYEDAYSMATGGDGAAPVLSIVSTSGVRMLDECNIPDTGLGG